MRRVSDQTLAELGALGWLFIVLGGLLFIGLIDAEGAGPGLLFAITLLVVGTVLARLRYVRRRKSGDDDPA